MENLFLNCCFDFTLVGTRSDCDRRSCNGNHDPVFDLYYQRTNNEYCYCLNRNQLGQYWQCVVRIEILFVQVIVKVVLFAKK